MQQQVQQCLSWKNRLAVDKAGKSQDLVQVVRQSAATPFSEAPEDDESAVLAPQTYHTIQVFTS
jgi:hypothetical protein